MTESKTSGVIPNIVVYTLNDRYFGVHCRDFETNNWRLVFRRRKLTIIDYEVENCIKIASIKQLLGKITKKGINIFFIED